MAPVLGETTEVSPGEYRGRLGLTMAGDWVLLVRVTLAGGRTFVRTIPLDGVAPN
jgi:hypothetical protein